MWDFEAVGLPALSGELQALEDGLGRPEALLKGIAPLAGADVRKNFEAGGRPETWPDITAKSRAQRTANKTSGPLLDTGALEAAASASAPGTPGSVFSLEGDTLTLGTDLAQAAVQQYGDADRNIPARAYEQITLEDEFRLQAFQEDYLHGLLGGEVVS